MHKLSAQQQISLEMHQHMVDSALRWQQHGRPAAIKTASRRKARIHHILATILRIMTR
jgi:hypothetical protein